MGKFCKYRTPCAPCALIWHVTGLVAWDEPISIPTQAIRGFIHSTAVLSGIRTSQLTLSRAVYLTIQNMWKLRRLSKILFMFQFTCRLLCNTWTCFGYLMLPLRVGISTKYNMQLNLVSLVRLITSGVHRARTVRPLSVRWCLKSTAVLSRDVQLKNLLGTCNVAIAERVAAKRAVNHFPSCIFGWINVLLRSHLPKNMHLSARASIPAPESDPHQNNSLILLMSYLSPRAVHSVVIRFLRFILRFDIISET